MCIVYSVMLFTYSEKTNIQREKINHSIYLVVCLNYGTISSGSFLMSNPTFILHIRSLLAHCICFVFDWQSVGACAFQLSLIGIWEDWLENMFGTFPVKLAVRLRILGQKTLSQENSLCTINKYIL